MGYYSRASSESSVASSRAGFLDRVFRLSEHGTSVRTEISAGLTTFFVMAYILFVNPTVLSLAGVPGMEGKGLAQSATLTATALVAGIMTIAMGLVANRAFALASGLGINALVAYQLVSSLGLTFPQAMGVIVLEGAVVLVLTQTNFREAVMLAIPTELKRAIAVGIGFFIAFIGFYDAGFIVKGTSTPVQLGNLNSFPILVSTFGLAVLIVLRTVGDRIHPLVGKAYLLIGIILSTLFATVVNSTFGKSAFSTPGVGQWPANLIALPDFSTIGHVDLFGVFGKLGVVSAVLIIFSVMLSDFFDTMGTLVGVGAKAGYLDSRGNFVKVRRPLLVDSAAAIAGGLASASSATTYIESAAGIEAGGRTGLTSVVTGICFLIMMFISPIAGVIPAQATAPALIMVGWMMMTTLAESEVNADKEEGTTSGARSTIPFGNFEIGFPAALTILVMPFTYSITNGIGAGVVSYVLIQVFKGRARNLHPGVYVVGIAFLIYFLQAFLNQFI